MAQDFVKRNIQRGFSSPMIVKIAREMQREMLEEQAKPCNIDASKVTATMDLYDMLTDLKKPLHLKPYIDALDRSLEERVRIVFSAPPQHGKTFQTLVSFVNQCIRNPGRIHAYVTYSTARTQEVAKDFVYLLKRLNIKHTKQGGVVTVWTQDDRPASKVRFTSIDGQLTGQPITGLAVIDDPIKNADDARSTAIREKIVRFFNQTFMTRGLTASVVVMMTRWTHDDLSGWLIKEHSWPCINLKALCDDPETDPLGRKNVDDPLWPDNERTTFALLDEARARDPVTFYKMYQGEPVAEGQRLFNEPATFVNLPVGEVRFWYGLDLAYGGKKRSDWSVLWRLVSDTRGLTYIDRLIRKQCDITEFANDIIAAQAERMGPIVWKVGGQELAIAQLLRERGVERLECITAKGSKRSRAQDVADAWNNGRLLVPEKQSKALVAAIEEIVNFSGDDRLHDDCVDALGNAYHYVAQGSKAGSAGIAGLINPMWKDRSKAASNAFQKAAGPPGWNRLGF